MSSPLKEINWMACPLAIDQRNELNSKITTKISSSTSKNVRVLKHLRKPIDPTKEVHVFRKIQHWTLEIDGKCYELSPDTKKKLQVIKKATDMIKPHWIDAGKWREVREIRDIKPEKRTVGQTRKTHEEIMAEVNYIWKHFNGDWYGFFTQNCQNFAHMLFERIAIVPTPGDKEKSETRFQSIPDPIGYRLADGAQLALATKIAGGGKAAYIGATAAKAGTTVGAATTSGGGGVIGSTTAAASTAGSTAGTTAGTMGAATTSGAAVGGTTTAAAGTTTAVAGTTTAAAGTTTAAGSTAATTASTTAGASAGHIGMGAKAAGFASKAGLAVHSGHAAAIGSGMVKVGLVAAWTHPVTSLAMTGGLAYLAFRGKRGKGWIRKNRDVTGFELLIGEDVAFEMAGEGEDGEEVEEVVKEVGEAVEERIRDERGGDCEVEGEEDDDDLAEDLSLGLVVTEPASMETGDQEMVADIENTKRAQTTV